MTALYTTQGGGVCRFDGQHYYWTEVPAWLTTAQAAEVGDTIPDEWGVTAINDAGMLEAESNR